MATIFFLGMMGVAVLAGGAIQGSKVAQKRCQLQKQTESLNSQISDYSKTMANKDQLLRLENTRARIQTQKIARQIANEHRLMKLNYREFKDSYNVYIIGGIIFLMIMIFALAFKKFVLQKNY